MAEHIVKIELGEGSRKLLETLLQEIRVVSDTTELIRLAMANSGTPFDTPAAPAEQPAPATEEPPAATAPEPRKVERDDVRKKVVDLSADPGKKAQVREIIKAYADSVSALPEDKLPEVWDKLIALEAEVTE